MKTLRVYLDTSVVGGCLDPEFAPWSLGLVADLRTMEPVDVATGPEALALLAAYEAHAVLGPRYRADMLHLALATVAEADVLVSWNFRHIVRLDKIRLFDAVNVEQGYRPVAIRSPREVTTYGHDPDADGAPDHS